jgi:branched-chain amino acid transport system substrate-binding protein
MFKSLTMVVAFLLWSITSALAADQPGVSEAEVRIGGTFPFSGPASSLGNVGRGLIAYIKSINDRGGINGRRINYIAYDDSYSPPKAVEHTRRLIESDEVSFIFGSVGTQSIAATIKYVNASKVPHLFVVSGASRFANFNDYPYTTVGMPSYRGEGAVYARYVDETLPLQKVALLYQNDDLGRDFVKAFREYYKWDFDRRVVTSAYETQEPTIESHIARLWSSGASALVFAGTPKFAAQAIRKVYELNWKPLFLINYGSSSAGSTIIPAGPDKAIGVIAATISKSATDPNWDNDPGMIAYRAHFAKYLPGADIADNTYINGTQLGQILEQLLKQCGQDLSRDNILKQARNLQNLVLPTTVPGLVVSTGPNSSVAYTQLRLQRWSGSSWQQFGDILSTGSD